MSLTEATIGPDGQIIFTGEDGTQSSKNQQWKLFTYLICFIWLAFPVSGMVTIPVSMYQTVVTNIHNLAEGLPIAMSAINASPQQVSEVGNDEQVNDASTTTVNEDVKTVLNGTQTAVVVSEEES